MKIQYCSDLHLEFPLNRDFLKANPIKPEGDILLMAGDIIPFTRIEETGDFFNFLSDSFQHVYWVPGNHEYYGWDIGTRTRSFHEKIRTNLSLVNNMAIESDGVRLLLSTLWSKINPADGQVIQKSMADFRLIRSYGRRISLDDYDHLHEECRAFLTRELENRGGLRTIVVTHHLPTFYNYPEKYKHSVLNTAFATELFGIIETSDVDHWIFGHNHEVVEDFKIGTTTLTSNQLGYVEHNEHLKFSSNRLLSR